METLNIRLLDLRTFCSVVETGSLAQAARHMNETKSTISRRITRLEDHVGVKLFDRMARSSVVTESGKAFYVTVDGALRQLEGGIDTIMAGVDDLSGTVRIAAPVDLTLTVVPTLFSDFMRAYPSITMNFKAQDAPTDLAQDRIDISVKVTNADSLPDMDYAATNCGKMQMGLFAGSKSPASSIARASDLQEHRGVFPVYDNPGAEIALVHERGNTAMATIRSDAVEVSDYATALRFIATSDVFGVLPLPIAAPLVEAGDIVHIIPEWSLHSSTVWVVTRAGKVLPRRVHLCKMHLVAELKALLV